MNVAWEFASYQQPANSMWTLAQPTDVIIPRDGLYQLTGGLALLSLGLTGDVRMNLIFNGQNVGGQRLNNVGQNVQLQASSTVEATAGQVVQMLIVGAGGRVVNIRATNLSVVRIGPVRWTGC